MPRTIITAKDSRRMSDAKIDNYIDKLLKFIPSEIVVLYVGLIPFLAKESQQVEIIVAAALVVTTYFYLLFVQKVKKQRQIILSCICFVAWIFALGGPFKYFDWYVRYPFLPLLVLGGFTLFLGKADPGTIKEEDPKP